MNFERIRNLAEQAGFIFWEREDRQIDWSSDYDAEIVKFAQLLVAECIDLVDNNHVGAIGTHGSAYNSAVSKCAQSIKQHFGVE